MKKNLLSVIAVLFLFAGPSFGEPISVAQDAVDAAQAEVQECATVADSVKDLGSSPTWMFGEGPLDPGGCDDCAGGCSYSCFSHFQCQQQCPSGIGSCTQSGKCLCACACNNDGICDYDEEDTCADCADGNNGPG